MTPKKAIIIGGGIAGPVAAMFFQRAGIQAEVYEARSEIDLNTGFFLNLAANGIEALKLLGLDAPVTKAGSPVPQMVMWNGKGKRLGEVRNGARTGLTESVIIRRGELQQILHDGAVQAGIPFHFNKKLRDIVTSSNGVTAHFEDGTSATGDFLVGCDGVHSKTRQMLNPNAPKPEFTQLISTGGFTRNLSLAPTPNTQHFFFGKQAFFGYHVRSSGEIYWFNNHTRTQAPEKNELNTITSNQWKQLLLEQHRDDLPIIQEIIRSTEDGIGGYPIYDIATQPVWYKNHVVLIGDAIHAVSPSAGQGASLAIEDAGVLAKCVRDIPNLTQAFAAYENLRRDRVEKAVKWARTLGSKKTASNAVQSWFRDMLMPFFLKAFANAERMDWVYGYQIGWGEDPIQEAEKETAYEMA